MITAIVGAVALTALLAAAIAAGFNSATATHRLDAGIARDTRAALIDDAAEQAFEDEQAGVL